MKCRLKHVNPVPKYYAAVHLQLRKFTPFFDLLTWKLAHR